ncbi:hypothetical protein [Micromonospora sp. WMMD1219]
MFTQQAQGVDQLLRPAEINRYSRLGGAQDRFDLAVLGLQYGDVSGELIG